ncbi:MAG TPA: aminoacyl-tRNA hydrolase [Parachlamydiaceae bacterium]|nr:aminoacyl-tRNA hydrolase [Parachlamydiaceae bacterium]
MSAPSAKISLIAGLGNPGKKYEFTRHNLGWLVVQELAAMHGLSFKDESAFNAKVAIGQVFGRKIHLLLPTTYMNESGRAIKRYLDFYKLSAEELLVVSDDVAIAFGEMRFRLFGSAGGHNGLKSIEAHLGSAHYARLRMGVGADFENKTLADHVLEVFSDEELKQLAAFVQKGATFIGSLV